MNNYDDEVEIDLFELFFSVCRKIPFILMTAVVLMMVGGIFGYTKVKKEISKPDYKKKEIEEYNENLYKYNQDKAKLEREIDNLNRDIANQEEYLENSIYLNMDSHNIQEARADIYVDTGYQIMPELHYQSPDRTAAVLTMYNSYLTSNRIIRKIADELHVETRYVSEIVTTEMSQNCMLTIKVRHSNDVESAKILGMLLDEISNVQLTIAEKVTPHTVTVMSRSSSSYVDTGLQNRQKEEENRLVGYKDSLEEKTHALESLKAPSAVSKDGKAAMKKEVAKFSIIGFIGGVALAGMLAACLFIFGGKANSQENISQTTGSRILGVLAGENRRKKSPWGVILDMLEHRKIGPDTEYDYEVIASLLANYVHSDKVVLVGDMNPAEIKEISDKLSEKLKDCELIAGANLFTDSKTISKVLESDDVILVCSLADTKLNYIKHVISRVKDMNKNYIGCICVEKTQKKLKVKAAYQFEKELKTEM